jgi:anaerobic magnesium-protoporphyrin IX monomethyl ester cyclase
MRILFFRQNMFRSTPAVSLGMGIIGTILKEAGHEVKIIDNNSFYKTYSDDELLKIAKDYKPDMFAFNVLLLNAFETYRLVKKVKALYPDHLIVGGGIHMRHCARETLENGFDIVCRHEGETIAEPLFRKLDYKKRGEVDWGEFESLEGVLFRRDDGSIFETFKTPVIENLDDITYPDLDLFNLQDFFKLKTEPGVVHINGQRGCPYACVFCTDTLMRTDKRNASAEYMFNWVKYYYETWGIRYFFVVDNNFLIPRKRAVKFCELLIESGLNKVVDITVQTKLDTINAKSPIKLLKEAGIIKIQLGLERMTPFALEKINKPNSPARVKEVMTWFKEEGLVCHVNILIGFPFETVETLRDEVKAFRELSNYAEIFYTGILQPMPGTPYYDDYPKVKGWHLDEDMNRVTKSYHGMVMELAAFDVLRFNYYDFSDEVLHEIKSFLDEFKELNHGNIILEKTFFSSAAVEIDKLIAKFALLVFRLSPSLELKLFGKVKALRYYFAMLLFAKKMTNNVFKDQGSVTQ